MAKTSFNSLRTLATAASAAIVMAFTGCAQVNYQARSGNGQTYGGVSVNGGGACVNTGTYGVGSAIGVNLCATPQQVMDVVRAVAAPRAPAPAAGGVTPTPYAPASGTGGFSPSPTP